jgi:triosephosphate isomerase
MRKPLIAGNWKMHGGSDFVAAYAVSLAAGELPSNVTVLLLPPAPYVRELAAALSANGVPDGAVELGVQNVHAQPDGAFTGELSAEMARDLGATWTLVGHSERRTLGGESDEAVAHKLAAALRAGLIPVLCVGETLAERDAGSAVAVVERQISCVAQVAGSQALAQAVIAYEPVWAIGTGRTATPSQAQQMHAVVRARVAGCCGEETARAMRILYGGSVKPDNAQALLAEADIDGALVGGASLDATNFRVILEAARPS